MKSSTLVFASLVAALATFSQSAIAASSSTFSQNSSINWHYSSLNSSSANSFKIANKAVVIDNDALTVGSLNRTNLLKCSESAPCIEDKLVIDRYKETLSFDSENGSVDDSSKIRSVREVRDRIYSRLNPPKWCDTGSCLRPLNTEICSLLESLDRRVRGRILGTRKKSQRSLNISEKELRVMKLIWSQCKLIKESDIYGTTGTKKIRIYAPSSEKKHNEIKKGILAI